MKTEIKYNAICPVCGSFRACKDWAYVGGKGRLRAIYCHSCGEITTADELVATYKRSKIRSYLETAAYQILNGTLTVEQFKRIIK
jgi:ribosomal protein S26